MAIKKKCQRSFCDMPSMWISRISSLKAKRYYICHENMHGIYVTVAAYCLLHKQINICKTSKNKTANMQHRFSSKMFSFFWLLSGNFFCWVIYSVFWSPFQLSDIRYNALSFVFLRVRELSWLQWHPFSVSSSPLDGQHHLSVLVKVFGEWTRKLRDNCSNVLEQSQEGLPCQPYSRITASVEGPYGHDSGYHLAYVLYSSSLVHNRLLEPSNMVQNFTVKLISTCLFLLGMKTLSWLLEALEFHHFWLSWETLCTEQGKTNIVCLKMFLLFGLWNDPRSFHFCPWSSRSSYVHLFLKKFA